MFSFFARAENLQSLTPRWLHFQILTPPPVTMGHGTLIAYRIRLHGIPVSWISEITTWDPPHVFVDTQVRGPYRTWVHTHRFTSAENDTLVDDEVQFTVPGGRLVAPFVARDLKAVFSYRHEALLRTFDLLPAPVPPIAVALS